MWNRRRPGAVCSWVTLNSLLRRQAGVLSRAQAMSKGLSWSAVDRRLATGRWVRLHPSVYLVDGARPTDEVRLRAAVLWAGPTAVASGPWAAWWHGMLERPTGPVIVTVGPGSGRRDRDGVRIRRRRLAPTDVEELRGIPLTAPPLTVLEAAVALDREGPASLDRALQRWVSHPALCRAHSRQLNATGSRIAGDLLVAAGDRAASAAERQLIKILRAAKLRGWRVAHQVGSMTLDVAFPRTGSPSRWTAGPGIGTCGASAPIAAGRTTWSDWVGPCSDSPGTT